MEEATLVAFYFDDEIRELVGSIEEQLMGHPRGNSNCISRGQFLADATLDRAVAFLMGRHSFPVYQRSTDEQGRGARPHYEDVSLRFMKLWLPIGLAMGQKEIFVGKAGKLTYGGTSGVGGCFGAEGLRHAA